jgi:very-short-patch-repair endonuclease
MDCTLNCTKAGKPMKSCRVCKKPKVNVGQVLMATHLRELGLAFAEQVPVTDGRRWKWDFLLPDYRIVIEVDGYFKGRHGAGWGSDNEKANHGTMAGIRVLRFSTDDVKRGKAKAFLQEWLAK